MEHRPRKRLQSVHVRLRPEQITFIKQLSAELGSDMSSVIRDLIDVAVLVLNVADRITLKDLLVSVDYEKYLGHRDDRRDDSDAER